MSSKVFNMSPDTQSAVDAVGLGVVVGVLANILPLAASLLAVIWYLIRFYEWYRWRIIEKQEGRFE